MATERPEPDRAHGDDEYAGAGKKKITITGDRDLLRRIDTHARRHGLTRSALFSVGASLFVDDLLRRRE
ncbi:type II toxin-antitoxin system HicB family antitoxin [Paraburkholderia sprentiae WSM5005]|uniref:Type II toxin-antitoxin system HicB family antitoxin n=1 Tax=Paraburkholderia sprentiae WSM5005 TaxID=754502 RepID=A0A1I9YQN2_9BURK|nr:hypothetical protein [Paraburkholderia sprentiae]APA88510.2 type II toxin-antitoxin system HicB family antitoxin [Paraburkholderia sprentiae WSM5005]